MYSHIEDKNYNHLVCVILGGSEKECKLHGLAHVGEHMCLLSCFDNDTAVVAVTIPFAILFLPLFVSNFDFLSGILGVFPDRLLQINEIINTFDLYHIGGKIVGSIPIMLVIYPILSVLMVPLMYHVYHKTEIK